MEGFVLNVLLTDLILSSYSDGCTVADGGGVLVLVWVFASWLVCVEFLSCSPFAVSLVCQFGKSSPAV